MECRVAHARVWVRDGSPGPAAAGVSADGKMSKIAEMELTHRGSASSTEKPWRCERGVAKGGRRERDLRDERGGPFGPGVARELGVARNTVRRYLKSPEAMRPKPRRQRSSKLDAYAAYVERRLGEGLDNCVVLHRELRGRGYDGGYSILKAYVSPHRRRQPRATMRFETEPGEQAQVDWGSFSYAGTDGRKHRIWAFVMVLGWSRAIYVEFVRRADVASFMQCHVNAFEYFGGAPRRRLYDNAKVVVLGRDADGRPEWNRRMLDLSLRIGFELRVCQPYRAQTKGKVESGVKYVRGNLWPSVRFTDDMDLNRQILKSCDAVANRRVHGTRGRRPWECARDYVAWHVGADL